MIFFENLFKINESNIQLCCNLGVSKRSFNKSQGDHQILGFPGPKSPVQMIQIYEELGTKSPDIIADNLLKIFDKQYPRCQGIFKKDIKIVIFRDGDGVIEFKEFMIATHLSVRFLAPARSSRKNVCPSVRSFCSRLSRAINLHYSDSDLHSLLLALSQQSLRSLLALSQLSLRCLFALFQLSFSSLLALFQLSLRSLFIR